MAKVTVDFEASKLISLIENTARSDIRAVFVQAVLTIPRLDGLSIFVEEHGLMSSLGVYRGKDWCFAIRPAKDWLKVWVRGPELRSRSGVEKRFVEAFPFSEKNSSNELTVRISTLEELKALLNIMEHPAEE